MLHSKTTPNYTPLLRITSNTGLSSITILVPASVLLASNAGNLCSQRANA
jgi:hypothetical protein